MITREHPYPLSQMQAWADQLTAAGDDWQQVAMDMPARSIFPGTPTVRAHIILDVDGDADDPLDYLRDMHRPCLHRSPVDGKWWVMGWSDASRSLLYHTSTDIPDDNDP